LDRRARGGAGKEPRRDPDHGDRHRYRPAGHHRGRRPLVGRGGAGSRRARRREEGAQGIRESAEGAGGGIGAGGYPSRGPTGPPSPQRGEEWLSSAPSSPRPFWGEGQGEGAPSTT